MTLDEYMNEYGAGPTWFSGKLGVSTPTLWNWRNGRRKIPKAAAIIIEQLTNGKVKQEDWDVQYTKHKSTK